MTKITLRTLVIGFLHLLKKHHLKNFLRYNLRYSPTKGKVLLNLCKFCFQMLKFIQHIFHNLMSKFCDKVLAQHRLIFKEMRSKEKGE